MSVTKNVVVTGMGTLNPLGASVNETWISARKGVSGLSLADEKWTEELPVKVVGYAKKDPKDFIDYAKARRMDRSSQLALVAAREAWKDADITNYDPTRLAVSIGAGLPGAAAFEKAYAILFEKGLSRFPPYFIPMTMPNGPASVVASDVSALGSAQTLTSACASGAEAIANAMRLIQLDDADIVICGGTESPILQFTVASFYAMRALSLDDNPLTASRPFDSSRNGFVLSEGSAVLVLESEEHAIKRGARIYARLLGESVTSETHHVVRPDPEGDGPYRTMVKALAKAGVAASDISYVNAHATSTPLGDLAEAKAIKKVFNKHSDNVIVSATKSMTGHLIATAGALEAILTVKAVGECAAPPSINISKIDPEIDIRISSLKDSRIPDSAVAVSNSFGFGGHNVSLVIAAN